MVDSQPRHHATSFCDDPSNLLHTLDCGHSIFTSSDPPHWTGPTTKSSCSPNCLRAIYTLKPQLPYAWIKHTSLQPFVCPFCIEDCVRADYEILLTQHRAKGSRLVNDMETNVRRWTCAAIIEMVGEGGRICEGMRGTFAMEAVGACGLLGVGGVAETIKGTLGGTEAARAWVMRDRMPGLAGEEGLQEHDNEEHGQLDLENASQMAILQALYPDHATIAQEDVDGLAERLCDAKVDSGDGDVDMMDMVKGFDSLKT